MKNPQAANIQQPGNTQPDAVDAPNDVSEGPKYAPEKLKRCDQLDFTLQEGHIYSITRRYVVGYDCHSRNFRNLILCDRVSVQMVMVVDWHIKENDFEKSGLHNKLDRRIGSLGPSATELAIYKQEKKSLPRRRQQLRAWDPGLTYV